MKLLVWTPLIVDRSGLPRENGRPYIPGSLIYESLRSSAIYYYIKKDKEVEAAVKKYLLKERLSVEEVVKDIEEIIYEKHPELTEIKIPEKLFVSEEGISSELIEVFDLKEAVDEEDFKVEVFKGVVEFDGACESWERLKAISHSFCEALARMEHSMLGDHPLSKEFYEPLLNKLKTWEVPLRLGWWTEVRFKGHLLFFWRIKEVRENLKRVLGEDPRPRRILYAPRERATCGWCELKP